MLVIMLCILLHVILFLCELANTLIGTRQYKIAYYFFMYTLSLDYIEYNMIDSIEIIAHLNIS